MAAKNTLYHVGDEGLTPATDPILQSPIVSQSYDLGLKSFKENPKIDEIIADESDRESRSEQASPTILNYPLAREVIVSRTGDYKDSPLEQGPYSHIIDRSSRQTMFTHRRDESGLEKDKIKVVGTPKN